MNKQLLAMMNEAERELLRTVYDGDLDGLDEDDLVELHGRVRRARTKYSKLYRRRSAATVKADRGRSTASAANERTARKAEIFEDALAKVSNRLARAARATAAELKQERLAAARGTGDLRSASASKAKSKAKPDLPAANVKRRTGVSKRASAQARAATRQKQAKRAAKR